MAEDKFRQQIEAEQTILEKIVEVIPGYRSYRQRERRREVDKAVRSYLVSYLKQFIERLKRINLDLVNKGRLDFLDDVDRLVRQLEGIMDKVNFASYGYSGFFDAIKIRTKELQLLYEFDLKILDKVKTLQSLISEKEPVTDSVQLKERLDTLDSTLRNFENLIEDRNRLIIEHKGLGTEPK